MKWRNVETGAVSETPGKGTWLPVLEGFRMDETYTDPEGRIVFTHTAEGDVVLGEGQTWESALRFLLTSQRRMDDAYNRRRDVADAEYWRTRIDASVDRS